MSEPSSIQGGESVTPEGVADVLGEGNVKAALSTLLGCDFPHHKRLAARKAIEASHRALASYCAEQDAEIKGLNAALHRSTKATDDAIEVMETWMGLAEQAEARCLELEAALRDLIDNIGGHSHWREGGAGGVCQTCEQQHVAATRARATLTPTVETWDCGCRFGGPHDESCALVTSTVETEPACECDYDRDDEGEWTGDMLRDRCPRHGPEPLSEGVTEPASSASGGQARVDEAMELLRGFVAWAEETPEAIKGDMLDLLDVDEIRRLVDAAKAAVAPTEEEEQG